MQRDPIHCFRGGIGDELLLSAVAREARRRSHTSFSILAEYSELFTGNPNVGPVLPYSRFRYAWHRFFTRRLREIAYTNYVPETDANIVPPAHIVAVMCAFIGIKGRIATHPELYLSQAEKNEATCDVQPICIHTSGRSGKYPIANKEWYFERFQVVVDALRGEVPFIQLGSLHDPLLAGVQDLRGRTRIRETAAILSQARLFVGLQGFLMHLARAVSCPAVIIYGGREEPSQSGYSCFTNLISNLPCAPCWQWTRCDYNRQCMRDIDPTTVVAAIRNALQTRRGDALPADEIELDDETTKMLRKFLRETLRDKSHLLRGIA